jgi:hypothetical protein
VDAVRITPYPTEDDECVVVDTITYYVQVLF